MDKLNSVLQQTERERTAHLLVGPLTNLLAEPDEVPRRARHPPGVDDAILNAQTADEEPKD